MALRTDPGSQRTWTPLGYMLKRVRPGAELFPGGRIAAIHSVSGCISHPFGDFIPLWRHNGWWLFDAAEAVEAAAAELGADGGEFELFYFEGWPEQFDGAWSTYGPAPELAVDVEAPTHCRLLGYDVVSYSAGTGPECSPLSCNGLAGELAVNSSCLFDRFEDAKASLEAGRFEGGEPGPFRIVAVHSVPREGPP